MTPTPEQETRQHIDAGPGGAVSVLKAKPAGHALGSVELKADTYATGVPAGITAPVDQLPFPIGLTATPAKQTFAFFNQNPVMESDHDLVVTDGVNVDFEVLAPSSLA